GFFFRHRDKDLGTAVVLQGDEPGPVTVCLQKCASLTGRLVDDDGLPRPGWVMGLIHKGQLNINCGYVFCMQKTEQDGQFRMEGVIPGLKFALHAGKNHFSASQNLVPELTLQAGEVKDLGDLRRKEEPDW